MNDLDRLRSTLDSHADAVSTGETHARIAAVRHRVRTVRNRRRAAVAGGAAVVLAVVGGVAALPDRDTAVGPASETDGRQAPAAEITALGFTYELTGRAEGGEDTVSVRLPAADEPRLVSWGTSGDDDTVRIESPVLNAPVTFTDPDFTNWTVVPAGAVGTVKATSAAGSPMLAIYELTDERPAGVTKDGVTFREEIAGGRLIDAAIGDAGQSEVSVSGVSSGSGVRYVFYCSGGPEDAWVHVTNVGGSSDCDDTLPTDPADGGGVTFRQRPGEQLDNRLYVTAGEDGPRVEDSDIRVGVGVYALDDYRGPGDYLPLTTESAGHLWQRVEVQRGESGSTTLAATAPRDRGPVLTIAAMASRAGRVDIDFGNSPTGFSGGGATQEVVDAGETVTLASGRDRAVEASTFSVGFYVRAD